MPTYELVALPGQTQQSFVLLQTFVPASSSGSRQTLTAFLAANSDPSDYGQLTEYTIPSSEAVDGPYLVSTAVSESYSISQEITLLNHDNSKVVLGNVVLTPIGQSLLYTQSLYVEQTTNQVPSLQDVIVVYDGKAFQSGPADPTLDAALCNVTNPGGGHPFASYCPAAAKAPASTTKPKKAPSKTVSPPTTSTTTSVPVAAPRGAVAKDLAAAEQDFALAQAEKLASQTGKTVPKTTTRAPQAVTTTTAPARKKHSPLEPSNSLRAQPIDQRSAAT